MTYSHKQRQSAYKRLPEDAQNLIGYAEVRDLIYDQLKELGLTEDQIEEADREIFDSLICLQTIDTSLENISKATGKDVNYFSLLKENLESEVFAKYVEYGINAQKLIDENKNENLVSEKDKEKIQKEIDNLSSREVAEEKEPATQSNLSKEIRSGKPDEEKQRIVDTQFKTLPKNLQRAIALTPWRFSIQEIGKSMNLLPAQIETLEREVMIVLYGFELADSFVSNLVKEAGFSQEIAEKIGSYTDEKIFKAVIIKKDELDKNDIIEDPNKKEQNYMIPNTSQDPRDEAVGRLEEAANLPEIAPEIHPQVIPGETAQENNPEETLSIPPKHPETPTTPRSTYPDGQDPYREPVE